MAAELQQERDRVHEKNMLMSVCARMDGEESVMSGE